jgi:hypothetical protein
VPLSHVLVIFSGLVEAGESIVDIDSLSFELTPTSVANRVNEVLSFVVIASTQTILRNHGGGSVPERMTKVTETIPIALTMNANNVVDMFESFVNILKGIE